MRRAVLLAFLTLAFFLTACGGSKPSSITKPHLAKTDAQTHSGFSFVTFSISGPAVGDIIVASTGTWTNTPTSFTYQWQRCSPVPNCSAIAGATASQYTVQTADVGKTIRVVVTATNSNGSTTQTSAVSGTVVSSGGVSGNYFVAQSSTGTGDGSSCTNAAAVSNLSTSTHWVAGNVIGLCGTITSQIVAQGSGTSSSPITVFWEPGSTMSAPDWPSAGGGCGGCAVNTNNQTYLTFDGGNNGTSIQATQSGSGLADQGISSRAFQITGCTGCVFKNLTISNMYVHSVATDTSVDQTQDNAFYSTGGGGYSILNNTINNVGWAIVTYWNNGDGNVTISGNNVGNMDHGWVTGGAFTGGSIGQLLFYGNHFHDEGSWDTPSNAYHHDGIHCFSPNASGFTPHYTGLYIYNNRFDGNTGANITSNIFIEGASGAGSTPCADSTSNIWIFNNVLQASQVINLGNVAMFSGTIHFVNNTIIGAASTTGVAFNLFDSSGAAGSNTTFQNNVVTTTGQLMTTKTTNFNTASDRNVYANSGSNAFVCGSNFYSTAQFSSWQSCVSADSHSTYSASASLNSDGSPQVGSPAVGAGTNLTSSCTGVLQALCFDINGTPRPSSAAWDAGAFKASTCTNTSGIPVGYPNNCTTGYKNAPGYPGTLSTTCPTTFASNTTYSFCKYTTPVFVGNTSTHPTNVTFIGCLFEANEANPANDIAVGDYATSVTFSYSTFAPIGEPAPPISNTVGYDHGIDQRYAGGFSVDHSEFYGFAEGIELNTSSQTLPINVSTSWFHDARNDGGSDHTDGILDNSFTAHTDPYMVFNNNSIASAGNTNGLALQNTGGYDNLTVTNNYFSGFGYTVNISQASAADTNTVFQNNVYGSNFVPIFGPLYGASFPAHTNGNVWSGNKYYIVAGASSLNPAVNGQFWWPTDCFATSNCGSNPAGFTAHATDFP